LHQNGVGLSEISAEAMADVARRGHISVLKYLHTNGMRLTEIGADLMRQAVQHGQVGVIKYLVHQAGASLQHVRLDDLVIAMEHGHLQMLRLLANRGVSMEQVKAVALDRAAVKKFSEIVELFRGADSLVHPSVITIDNHRSCNAACRMCPPQSYDAGSGA
jgi:hypothetical protein